MIINIEENELVNAKHLDLDEEEFSERILKIEEYYKERINKSLEKFKSELAIKSNKLGRRYKIKLEIKCEDIREY